jgi:uncharacterized cysteine cluster protein YcgN (CxxCxxCC family)
VTEGEVPFWKRKKLAEMSRAEWESLCDGCALCCLIKLEGADGEGIFETDVACKLLDLQSCRCTRYAERSRLVPNCVTLHPGNVGQLPWMPATCAYRLLYEGKELYSWHPLVSGDPESVHKAGVSLRGAAISETDVADEDLEDHIVGCLEGAE